MFWKKKLYKVTYHYFSNSSTIVTARNEIHAIKKFSRKWFCVPDIISVEEITFKED